MSDVAIRVENLGKSYRLQRTAGQPRYRTLREDLRQAPGRLWSALRPGPAAGEEFWALREVSFELNRGEVLGVIGRNGAGKSTLLKILSRIVAPATGAVDLYGRVGSLLEVGTGFHPELTGRENIFLSGAMLGMRRAEVRARLDEIVAFAEVEQFIDTPCKHYSSGMFMRLGFAVAAHLSAEILVVDEVLAVGDAAFQRKCLGKMKEASSGGRTVLFVSHNLATLQALCPRSLWLGAGRVQADGATAGIVSRYLRQLQEGQADGLHRGARTGNGGGQILTFAARPVPDDGVLTAGARVQFEVTVVSATAREGILVGIGIDAEGGGRLATLFSFFTHASLSLEAGVPRVVACTVAALPLGPGRYWVSLHLAQGGEELEHLDQAAAFDVVPGDFFGTGRLPSPEQGALLLTQDWRLLN